MQQLHLSDPMQQLNHIQDPKHPSAIPPVEGRRPKRRIWLWVVFLILAVLLGRAIKEKFVSTREATRSSRESAYQTVQVTHPQVYGMQKELILPGNVRALSDTPIFARTSGYVRQWLVDIGARVQQSQLLAEIESPEVDQQLNQALGNVQRAQANTSLAHVTAERWRQMLARNTVSRQETDEKVGNFEAQRANLAAAQADFERLRQLKGFEQVFAPFDGVITARNINIGDLIVANNTGQKEMFRIADDSQLRIYVNIPENAASFIKVGQTAAVVLASAPNQVLQGQVVNVTNAIDPKSRTMLTEVRVSNAQHKLFSGGYATVTFDLKLANPPITIPVNTLLFRPQGTMVAVVGDNGRISLHKVEIGRDFGNYVEITNGLSLTDRVIVNPSDSLEQDDQVRVEKPIRG